jgi:hypothetical protein
MVSVVTPGHFETLGVEILRGRDLAASDRAGVPPVAVVSRAFADRYWPGQDPIGKQLRDPRQLGVRGGGRRGRFQAAAAQRGGAADRLRQPHSVVHARMTLAVVAAARLRRAADAGALSR